MSAPETSIYLCSGVRLNSAYVHSIYFENTTAQYNYFRGKVVKTLTAYSFVRRSWTLKVDALLTEAVKWNYLFFHYPNDGKYYYYFINKVEYVNDSTVELTLELDLLQTYLFDVTLGQCYIEREHVADDTLGLHTVDEGLDTGDYITGDIYNENYLLDDYAIMILSTFNPQTATSEASTATAGGKYGSVYSGLGLYAVQTSQWEQLNNKIKNLGSTIEGIVAMWMYPKALIELEGDQQWNSGTWCKNVWDVGRYSVDLLISAFDVIKPKNNKLLTFPFRRLHVHNSAGGEMSFAIERFENPSKISFEFFGGLSPDSGVIINPYNYLGENRANVSQYTLSTPSFPTCAWDSDTYKIWLTQNKHNVTAGVTSGAVSVVGGVAATVAGAATAILSSGIGVGAGVGMIGGGVSSFVSGINQINTAIGSQSAAAQQPNHGRGNFASSTLLAKEAYGFVIEHQQITPERFAIIDNYFTTFGYKVNRLGVPSKKNRKAFTYIKTMGCHAYGNITNEDITKIQAVYDKGITWWVNGDSIGDYTLDNSTL